MTKQIWIVEDDEDIREIALYALRTANFETRGFESGDDFFTALRSKETSPPDLVILDIMLPGGWSDTKHPARPCSANMPNASQPTHSHSPFNGLDILKKLRQDPQYETLPIMMLTAKSSEHDKVKGLDLGADDYLTKPFGVMELISRIKALLRRSIHSPNCSQEYTYQGIMMNHTHRTVTSEGCAIALTFKEYELLYYLLINKGIVLSREKILDAVWGYDYEGESRTLDMHIKRLRQKLGTTGEHVKTIRNVGYKLGD